MVNIEINKKCKFFNDVKNIIKIIYLYEWLKIKLHMLYLNIKFA